MTYAAAYDAEGRPLFATWVGQEADLDPVRAAHAHVITSASPLDNTWRDPADGQAKPRAALPAPNKTRVTADGAETVRWSGLPDPTRAILSTGAVVDVTDGYLELTFDMPGDYTVVLTGPPAYTPREDRIHAAS